jgi:hypothetical protein
MKNESGKNIHYMSSSADRARDKALSRKIQKAVEGLRKACGVGFGNRQCTRCGETEETSGIRHYCGGWLILKKLNK